MVEYPHLSTVVQHALQLLLNTVYCILTLYVTKAGIIYGSAVLISDG